jgi:LacI family transcriptional regulator
MTGTAEDRPVTIKAVAAAAGVSPSTVSRVLNGNLTVDPELAERVRAIAADLRYAASPLARSLVLGRTHAVAVLVPDLSNPTFQSVLHGVTRAAALDRYRVLIADSLEMADEEVPIALDLRRRCDAIVLCAPRMSEADLVALLPRLAPVVLINRDQPTIKSPVLTADYGAGIQLLTHHLHQLGHRRLVYLEGNPQSASNTARLRGLHAFLATHPGVQLQTLRCGVSFEQGYLGAEAVIAAGATGVIAFNDLVAMGLLSALSERGVSVPGDLSVVGFDDIPLARYTTPPLTTAAVPAGLLGLEAWKRLRALVEGDKPDPNFNLLPQLEVRASTGPPRA